MNWKQAKWRIKYFIQFFPFTVNTLLFGVATYFGFKLLNKPMPKDEPSAFIPFLLLMGKISLWFLIGLVSLSILSTFISWVYYLWLLKRKHYALEVSFTTETKTGRKNKLFLDAKLQGVVRPVLGFVKGRLTYDDYQLTDKFSLLSNNRKEHKIWRAAISGRSRISFPDIKEYQLKGGFIFFEDMLHLFSLAVPQQIGGHFYQPPVLTRDEDREVSPKKTETLDVRIEEMRRVEGEYQNYKSFESGDDVRRIVWKVYAKNRDLVVRVPEMYEPYASHLYFYASFYAAVKTQWLGEGYFNEMLNYYKNAVWTVYDTLSKKEWEMRYLPDQAFNIEAVSGAEKNARIIANSSWHNEKSLLQYFNARNGAVLCISSFTDPDELRSVLELCDASTVVYFIKVSKVFRHLVPLNWISRLVFQPSKDRLSKLRSRWTFSPIRLQVQKKEREIEDILNKSHVKSGVI